MANVFRLRTVCQSLKTGYLELLPPGTVTHPHIHGHNMPPNFRFRVLNSPPAPYYRLKQKNKTQGGIIVNEKGINVLEEYDLEIGSIRRGRGVLLVETNQGMKKLVEFKGTQTHVELQNTVQEKLSLVNRFGVTIFFSAPDKKQFQNIVKVLADRHGIEMPEEELLLEANKWELSHGGLSGRTAQQFIHYLLGKQH